MSHTKQRASDVQEWHFAVDTPRRKEYHLIFATSAAKATEMVEDRYLGTDVVIHLLTKEKKDA